MLIKKAKAAGAKAAAAKAAVEESAKEEQKLNQEPETCPAPTQGEHSKHGMVESFKAIKGMEGITGAFKMMLGDDLKEKIYKKRKDLEMTEKQIAERRQTKLFEK